MRFVVLKVKKYLAGGVLYLASTIIRVRNDVIVKCEMNSFFSKMLMFQLSALTKMICLTIQRVFSLSKVFFTGK